MGGPKSTNKAPPGKVPTSLGRTPKNPFSVLDLMVDRDDDISFAERWKSETHAGKMSFSENWKAGKRGDRATDKKEKDAEDKGERIVEMPMQID